MIIILADQSTDNVIHLLRYDKSGVEKTNHSQMLVDEACPVDILEKIDCRTRPSNNEDEETILEKYKSSLKLRKRSAPRVAQSVKIKSSLVFLKQVVLLRELIVFF